MILENSDCCVRPEGFAAATAPNTVFSDINDTDILMFFLAVHFSNYQLNAQFFYPSTVCMSHYAPQHVSSSTLLILRRTNCITTASGIVTLEIGLRSYMN